MIQDKIFQDMDILNAQVLNQLTDNILKVKRFLYHNDIQLSTEVGSNDERIGEVLINSLDTISHYLKKYDEIKDTWQCNTPA